jgi:hypothetical protein
MNMNRAANKANQVENAAVVVNAYPKKLFDLFIIIVSLNLDNVSRM